MRKLRIGVNVLVGTGLLVTAGLAQQITVYSSGSVAVGQTRQLTAYVPLAVSTVNWSVNGTPGGDSTFGTVSATGLYTAPLVVPMNNAVTVQATSTADAAKFGRVTITVTQPPVALWSVSPTAVPVGPFTIRLNGANFGANSEVRFGGVALAAMVLSSTSIQASGTATAGQAGTSAPVQVTNTGLGGTTSSKVSLSITAAAPVTVSVSPGSPSVQVNGSRQMTATVTGTTNTAVTWTVNGMAGGNATFGTISSSGLYTAPASVPTPATVTIRATSVANPSASGSALATIQPGATLPVTVSVLPGNVTVAPAATQQFAATVTNATNTAVTWSVNGAAGGNATVGTISATGLYTAPAAPPNPATVTVRAASVANPSATASAAVTVAAPTNPGSGSGTGNLSAARFLEQAAFGPTPSELAYVKQLGFDAWLTEQFALAETPVVDPGDNQNGTVRSAYLSRLSVARDQLRQRVAYALSQFIVISMNKNNYPNEIVPYLQILSRNAFGNYRTLLGEITVSPQMGKYLDLARSTKPGAGSGANENYPRELMQLFTIGVNLLNPDGSVQLDGQGRAIPAYDQRTVEQVALGLTGWVYKNNAWEDFSGPMEPRDTNHDMRQKTFLGCTLPANQTTVQDTNGVLDCLFRHPNVGPFIATRLVRSIVTSNPSPGYIQRVAAVFNDNGLGVRGDLKAVVRAMLMDAEARNDTAGAGSGRLKEPIYHIVAFARALSGGITPSNGLSWLFSRVGQFPLAAPSVFSFYSPLYRIPKSALFGPEFQIYTPTESVLRANFLWEIISNPGSEFTVDLSRFTAAAGNASQLIDAVDQALLYGRMPQGMRQSLATAIAAQQDGASRVQTALYLTALSGLYAVQY